MSLKRLDESAFLTRFLEFDEARRYIEDMKSDKELTFDAIDYMIYHKEYYFLLKQLYENFAQSGGKEIIEYLFARLDVCLHRQEDMELLRKLWHAPNIHIRKELFYYIVDCDVADLLQLLECEGIDFGYFLKVESSEGRKAFLKEAFTKRLEEMKKIVDYFKLYGEEGEVESMLGEIDAITK